MYTFGGVALILYLNHWYDVCVWVEGEPNQGKTQQLCVCQLRTTDSGKKWKYYDLGMSAHMVTTWLKNTSEHVLSEFAKQFLERVCSLFLNTSQSLHPHFGWERQLLLWLNGDVGSQIMESSLSILREFLISKHFSQSQNLKFQIGTI